MKQLSPKLLVEYADLVRRLKNGNINLQIDNPYLRSLVRLAASMHKLLECECNGCTREKLPHESWNDYDEARRHQIEWVEQRQIKVLATIAKNVALLDLHYYIQSDPRGGTLYLSTTKLDQMNYHQMGVLIR